MSKLRHPLPQARRLCAFGSAVKAYARLTAKTNRLADARLVKPDPTVRSVSIKILKKIKMKLYFKILIFIPTLLVVR